MTSVPPKKEAGAALPQDSTLTVSAELENNETVCVFVSNHARAAGMPEKDIRNVELAVDEACTNVVKHGYGENADECYSVTCSMDGSAFIIDIEDRGITFDMNTVPVPDLSASIEERPVGGLGIFIIKQIMDEVTQHTGTDGLHRLRMIKFIGCRQT